MLLTTHQNLLLLITPVDVFKVTFAVVNTEVVSEKVIALSEVPAIVVTVPEKLPAIVPKEPAEVVNDGAVDAVIILLCFDLRYHQDLNSYIIVTRS